jgi:hypothetical protein
MLQELLSTATCEREGDDLLARGLYLDAPPWQISVLALTSRVSVMQIAGNGDGHRRSAP